MNTIYGKPFTLDELVEFATKQRGKLYRNHAHHLCSAVGITPEEYNVAPYLHGRHGEDNLGAAQRWLNTYLGDTDILVYPLDLDDCICAFRNELHKKIPTNYWGDEA